MKKITTLFIYLFLFSMTLFAQTTGKLSGTVEASDGSPLIGANVSVIGTAMGGATDENGNYVILNVPVGSYSVRVDYIGYKSMTVSSVEVKGGLTSRTDFSLDASAIAGEEVVIVATKRLVEPSATNSVRTVGADDIQNSASRSVSGILDLQPGVVILNGQLHIRGGREEEVGYTVDGADIKDPISSGRLVTAIPEALSEIAIEAGGYGADIGGSNSGVVRQTMKTGGNDLTGSVRVESGNYGHSDLTATVSGPIGPVKYFMAFRSKHVDDHDPTFYKGFTIDMDGDGVADALPSYESGVTPDGDNVSIAFDPDAGIKSRWSDDLSFNGTALIDLGGPLSFRISGVIDNSKYMSNAIPIYNMFNESRLPESTANRVVLSARANYFVNPNFLVSGGFSMLNRAYESYDALFGKPGGFGDAISWGDSASVASHTDASEWRSSYQSPTDYFVGQFAFNRPGDIRAGWSKSNRSSMTFDVKATLQRGPHEIKLGFESKSYEYRSYYLSTSAIYNVNRIINTNTGNGAWDEGEDFTDLGNGAWDDGEVFTDLGNGVWDDGEDWVDGGDLNGVWDDGEAFTDLGNGAWDDGEEFVDLGDGAYSAGEEFSDLPIERAEYIDGNNAEITEALSAYNRSGNIGYDDYGNEINVDWDGPRKPTTTSFFINDKYETDDLVVNVGVRVDNFNLDDWKMKNPANPGWDETNQGIVEEEFDKSDTKTVVQPRLGFAFPVSDKTVFHFQYGKYAQMPELSQPYRSTRYMHLVWGGQNYTPDPMGFDLDPIETTQYELGLSYEFTDNVALDVTAFAKNTVGQLEIGKNRETDPQAQGYHGADVDALYYLNGDFSTINGVELTLRTRRINRLQAFASYTWSDARGVNSDANLNAGNISQEALAAPPAMIMPLYYENKHRGAVSFDYRFGPKDGGILFSNLGINLQYKFNSGHPFTLSGGGMGQRSADTGALLDDARAREPLEPIGQSTTPWNYSVNLKIDKSVDISGYKLTLFAYVENLFNTQNVLNVYSRSGNAYDDGFLTDPSLSSEIVAAQGDLYVNLYENVNIENRQHYMYDFGQDLFDTPRVVKFGASVNF